MRSAGSARLKMAFWASSIGLAILVARRLLRPRPKPIDVGSLSDAWIAQQRWPPPDPFV